MERAFRGFASLFESARTQVRASAWVLVSLAIIVAIGAFARLWGLDNVGLHGDEKTMVLPAMHLLRYGTPDMPSGFLYPRAVAQLYLMVGSALAFGVNDWAWRFPSAVCGVLLIPLAWLAGRRFLDDRWNLAFTAAVALLPGFIADAQTARMYVFLVAGVTGFMALLFAWERTGRSGWLVAAVIEMAISLEFHTLAIFAAWLCFLPGLLGGDRRTPHIQSRLLWQGAVAFATIAAIFLVLNHWMSMEYPHSVGSFAGTPPLAPRATGAGPLDPLWPLLALLPAIALARWTVAGRGWLAAGLLAASLVAQVSRLDHLGILLGLAALVVARRGGTLSRQRLAVFLAVCALLAAGQFAYLLAHRAGNGRQIIGLMLGWPSVWPFIAISRYSPAASLLAAAGVLAGLWRLAHRRPVPDFLLFFALGVWLPLLQIGYMRWDIPPRYAEAQIMPLLLTAFASAQWAAKAWLARPRTEPMPARVPRLGQTAFAAAAVVAFALVIDPTHLEAAVDPSYAHYPDGRGAAEFVRSQHPGPHDIIVAEDALMQTYYLGHVDYWLEDRNLAAPFLHKVDGRLVDTYTNTPLIGTGRQLERLVARRNRGAIYVIGSGEDQQDGRRAMRGLGIAQVLSSPAFHLVFVGRDGRTDVWKVNAPRHALTAHG
jgi:4-amino-4-deoxy-L-arabinose transferase-like glycosyltransferase